MTTDPELTLEPGTELDAIVAARCMDGEAGNYSTSIVAALAVMERVGILLFPVRAYRDYDDWNHQRTDGDETWWFAAPHTDSFPLTRPGGWDDEYWELETSWTGRRYVAPSAPLAICRAALRTTGLR